MSPPRARGRGARDGTARPRTVAAATAAAARAGEDSRRAPRPGPRVPRPAAATGSKRPEVPPSRRSQRHSGGYGAGPRSSGETSARMATSASADERAREPPLRADPPRAQAREFSTGFLILSGRGGTACRAPRPRRRAPRRRPRAPLRPRPDQPAHQVRDLRRAGALHRRLRGGAVRRGALQPRPSAAGGHDGGGAAPLLRRALPRRRPGLGHGPAVRGRPALPLPLERRRPAARPRAHGDPLPRRRAGRAGLLLDAGAVGTRPRARWPCCWR